VTVPADEPHHTVPTERLLEAIRTHRPVVVNLSHAAFESAYLHDVRAVAEACREVDAVFCLDAAQTGFVVPFTLESTGADVILLQQHKWGCAGTGAACMVVSERFIAASTPGLVGWMSHADVFAFERGAARLGMTARRFAGGTPEVPAKARGAVAAEIIIDQLGIKAVAAHNQKLVTALIGGLTHVGLSPIRVPRRTGFVAVECRTPARAKALELALRREHFVIDGRGSRLRIGPTFYNDQGDIERVVTALGRLNRTL
jgi:selenocysteine lyase/cysteine desulfurase